MTTRTDLQSSTTLNRQAEPVEVRNGVARFDNGAELAIRSVEIRANTAVETEDNGRKSRTVEVVWTTGAAVTRWSWADQEYYEESLEVSESAIRLGRMQDGASVLDSHWAYGLDSVLGTVEEVRIEDGKGIARIRMSNRASIDEVWQDIKDGIIRHISVGYRVFGWSTVRNEGETTRKVATDWEPHEISFVAVPADAGCSVRSAEIQPANSTRASENEMTTPTTTPAENAGNEVVRTVQTPAVDAVASVTAERQRTAQINRYASAHRIDDNTRDAAIDDGTSFADFASRHLDAIVERQEETSVTAHRTTAQVIGGLSPEVEAEARGEALTFETLRSMGMETPEISDNAKRFVGEGLFGAARFSLEAAGVSTASMRDAQILGRAFERAAGGIITTTDIASIAARPINAVLDNSFRESLAETDYQSWTGVEPSTNFHDREAINFGIMKGIRELSELGQMPLGSFGGSGVISEMSSHGMALVISRQAMINDNDDLGMFMENVRNTGLIWGPYIQGLAIDALLAGEIITKESGRQSVYVPYIKGKGGNYVEIPALDFDNYETLELAFYDQYHPKALGGGRVRNGRVGEVLVSPDLAVKARLIFKEVAGVANPYADENVTVTVLQDLPEGTGFLVPAGRMNKVLKRRVLRGQEGPVMERLPAKSTQRIEFETYWDGKFNFSSKNGFIKFKVV